MVALLQKIPLPNSVDMAEALASNRVIIFTRDWAYKGKLLKVTLHVLLKLFGEDQLSELILSTF